MAKLIYAALTSLDDYIEDEPAQLRVFRATAETIDALDENDRRARNPVKPAGEGRGQTIR